MPYGHSPRADRLADGRRGARATGDEFASVYHQAMISHIASAILYVSDQDESLAFYRDTLGFEVTTDANWAEKRRWLEVRPVGAQTAVVLLSAEAFDRSPGEGANLTFATEDVAATAAALRDHGATVTGPVHEPWGTYATVDGPDDHKVQFHERAMHS